MLQSLAGSEPCGAREIRREPCAGARNGPVQTWSMRGGVMDPKSFGRVSGAVLLGLWGDRVEGAGGAGADLFEIGGAARFASGRAASQWAFGECGNSSPGRKSDPAPRVAKQRAPARGARAPY